MAAWRLSLTSTSSNTACTSSAAEDFGDFTQLPETNGCDVGTQTEWSFNNKNRQEYFYLKTHYSVYNKIHH